MNSYVRYFLEWLRVTLSHLGVPNRFLRRDVYGKKAQAQIKESDSRVLAICDFSAFPLSYDIVYFLSAADAYRRSLGARWLDVVFLAHDSDPLNPFPEIGNPVENGNYRIFIHNIGVRASLTFPSVGNVSVFTNRSSLVSFLNSGRQTHTTFPEDYSPLSPHFSPVPGEPPLYGLIHTLKYNETPEVAFSLRPPSAYRKLARSWLSKNLGGTKFITITLRETPYQPTRSSNIPEWQKLIDHYEKKHDYVFVVLRDYYSLFEAEALKGENVIECSEAVLDIPFRAALYEAADVNLFVANGPAALCFFNYRTRYIVFDMGGPEASARPEDVEFQHGLKINEQIKGATAFQRLIWKEDTFPVLCAELDSLLEGLSNRK